MGAAWAVVVFVMLAGGILLALAARRTADEINPTIEAFARFRAAISPVVASLAAETTEARHRRERAANELGGAQG